MSPYRRRCVGPWIPPSRKSSGVSIVELVVAIAILGVGASVSARLLTLSSRSIEDAELNLRAAMFMSELSSTTDRTVAEHPPRAVGPGSLIYEGDLGGNISLRYEPEVVSGSALPPQGSRGFVGQRRWMLRLGP